MNYTDVAVLMPAYGERALRAQERRNAFAQPAWIVLSAADRRDLVKRAASYMQAAEPLGGFARWVRRSGAPLRLYANNLTRPDDIDCLLKVIKGER